MTVPTLYTLTGARKALGPDAPSVDTLRREIAKGNLHAKRIGRCLRVSDVELARWANDVDPSPSAPSRVGPATDASPAGGGSSPSVHGSSPSLTEPQADPVPVSDMPVSGSAGGAS